MNPITTRRSLLKFYVAIFFGCAFFMLLGSFLLYEVIDPTERAGLENGGKYIMPLLGALTLYLAFFTVYRYFKNAPTITVDANGITFGSTTYSRSEIANVQLTGKQPFPYIFTWPMEGAKLVFSDGTTRYIYDDMYTNAWQLKLFIQEIFIDKGTHFQLPDISIHKAELDAEDFETYSGNQFTSFRGILCWGVISFLLLLALVYGGSGLSVFMGIFCLLWLWMNTRLMRYFKVSQNFLVVKEHTFFWQKKAYRLNDIKEVVFETRDKMPNCLRVITKDFRTKLYPAATLRDKTWVALKDKLEANSITVRNECIYIKGMESNK